MGKLEKKHESNLFGKFAEEMAVQEYIRKGYAILERNWRLGKSEIDFIARKDNELIIGEVKARKNSEEVAVNSVNMDKRRRMVKAADAYINKLPGEIQYRFDIVTFVGEIDNYKLEIYENAFIVTDLI